MEVEILITADIIDYEYESIEQMKNVDHEVAFCDEGTYEFNRNGNQD